MTRAQMIAMLPDAKYPNLLLEVALHPMPPEVTAYRAGMTLDCLVSLILGQGTLYAHELSALRQALQTATGYPSVENMVCHDVLRASDLGCEDGTEALVTETRRILRGIRLTHPALPLLRKLLKQNDPPATACMMVDCYADLADTAPHFDYALRTA